MTVEDRYFASGTRLSVFYELDQTTGRIKAPVSHKAYYGLVLYGPKGLTLSVTEPRKVTHVGQDRPLQIDWLPALEAMDAELTVSATELNVETLVSGVKAQTVGTAQLVPILSSQQGTEPVVACWYARQAENISGLRRWESYIFSSAKVIYMPSSMTDGTSDIRYKIAPAISTRKIYGEAWSTNSNGATTAQMGQMATNNYPYLVGWQSGSTDVAFLFDTDKAALNATSAILGVWLGSSTGDALVPSSDYTAAVTGITFHVAPGLDTNPGDTDNPGKIITCLYEGPVVVRQ